MSGQANLSSQLASDFKRSKKSLYLLILIVIFFSVGIIAATKLFKADKEPPPEIDTILRTVVTFTSKGFPTLRLGHYTLWVRDASGQLHFFKRFNSVNGNLVSLNGDILTTWEEELPLNPTDFVVTIESEGDRNEEPNEFVFMEAPVESSGSQKLVRLKFKDIDLIQSPALSGSFILATPTDGNGKINEASGLWFVGVDKQTPTLNLSEIRNNNWIWQARIENRSLTTMFIGNFTSAQTPDSSARHSLTKGQGFSAPGEDLFINLPDNLTGPLNLANGSNTVIVSLEPNRDGIDPTGELVFIPVLTAEIPLSVATGNPVAMQLSVVVPELELKYLFE